MSIPDAVRKVFLFATLLLTSASSAGDAVIFKIETSDIQAIEEYQGSMWIQLAPSAASLLEEVTAQSHGRQLVVIVESMQIMSARVNVTIESGVIRADGASSEVRRRLEKLGYGLSNGS